jgi:hypothetical protein
MAQLDRFPSQIIQSNGIYCKLSPIERVWGGVGVFYCSIVDSGSCGRETCEINPPETQKWHNFIKLIWLVVQ